MFQFIKKNIQKTAHILGVITIAIIVGFSLPLTHAWTEPTLTAPNGNLAAPINVSATTQTKAGALYVTGGTITPLIWDTDNTLYYLNPFGASQVSSIFANGGVNLQASAGLNFSDHNGGFNMVDNSWIRATGVGNIYAPGEIQATNIRANSTLCIAGDCRNSWAAGGLQLDTWQGGHYSGSNGAEYANGFVQSPIFYDTNNTGYYVDPASTSRVNAVNFTSLYGVNWAPGAPRWDFSTYVAEAQYFYGHDATQTMYIGETNPVIVRGDIRAPIFYDQNNTGYYVDPNGTSQVSTIYANNWFRAQGDTGLYFQDHNSGINMTDNTWIRAYGAGNIYAPGEMQATNIRANSNLCIGADCRTAWPAATVDTDTLATVTARGASTATYSSLTGGINTPIMYDTNNTGYYVDPASSSRMNTLNYVDQAYIVDVRPQYMYDWNDSAYYIDMNSGSRLNYLGRNYGWNWTEYDWNDTTYYMDLNNVSILNDLRVNVLYDRQNTGYYIAPRATSRMNYGIYDNLYSYGWMQAPLFYDADDNSYMVNPNGGSNMYDLTLHNLCLRGDCRNAWPGATVEADTLATVTSRGTSTGSYLSLTGGINTPIMYDTNNTGYFVDPNGISNLNQVVADRMVSTIYYDTTDFPNYYVDPNGISNLSQVVTDRMVSTIYYDKNNLNYYIDPNGTSNLNQVLTDRVMSTIFYDTNDNSYYVDPNGSSNMRNVTTNTISFYNAVPLSDERLKENIVPLADSLEKIQKINGVLFNWKDASIDDKKTHTGVIAQNVEKVFPELVDTNPKTGIKGVEYGNFIAPIIESIKELVHKIDDLFAKYLDQQKQIDELRVEVEALKNSR